MADTTDHFPPGPANKVFLAYDGSINADWVSRYAIHIASNLADRRIVLLHVADGFYSTETIRLKIQAIESECAFHDVKLQSEILPLQKSVFLTLYHAIPSGPENFCVCGSRITSRGRGFLRGTISEKLLRTNKFNVMAIRVVLPGLLGCPDDLLFPLAGHPRGFYAAMPFFRLFVHDIHKLYLLRIMRTGQLSLHYMSYARQRLLYRRGMEYVRRVADEIRQETGPELIYIDTRVVIATDWVKEILVQASELRTRLILLGATEQSFVNRYLHAARIERILRKTPCDVAIYRKV